MTSPSLLRQARPATEQVSQGYGLEQKKRGAIYTKQSIVNFMLDLVDYDESQPLHEKTLLEPSFGGGGFVLTAASRLIASWKRHNDNGDYVTLLGAIRAVELDTPTFLSLKSDLCSYLESTGFKEHEAKHLANGWLVNGDYLGTEFARHFDFVVGNPPYVRQELIDPDLLARYRASFPTMVGRADLYVAFIEKSLNSLAPGGKLSFICADGWVKNGFGRALREKIGTAFHLRDYVDMYGVEAFDVSVGAYPSITVIQSEPPGATRVVRAKSADETHLREILHSLAAPPGSEQSSQVTRINRVAVGAAPWLLGQSHQLPIIRRMEKQFPTLVEAGCRIGIGVATGRDRAFIAPFDELDVEPDRKLPLATNKDVANGELNWTGKGIVNPYTDEGALVDLAEFPLLAKHFELHRAALEKRHTAKSNVATRWYKTIDRITPSLTWEEKLLIPDIKGNGDAIAYDPGTLYPHHNLYFVTSTKWNLRALQALLRSGIAQLFVEAYSVKIGGGYLRFQAQNLRRIRVPEWADVSSSDQRTLVQAGESGAKLDTSTLERLYQLEDGSLTFLKEAA